jgi:hypothetical protein
LAALPDDLDFDLIGSRLRMFHAIMLSCSHAPGQVQAIEPLRIRLEETETPAALDGTMESSIPDAKCKPQHKVPKIWHSSPERVIERGFISLNKLAPQVGFEPTTLRLTEVREAPSAVYNFSVTQWYRTLEPNTGVHFAVVIARDISRQMILNVTRIRVNFTECGHKNGHTTRPIKPIGICFNG